MSKWSDFVVMNHMQMMMHALINVSPISRCASYPAIPSYCKLNKVPGLCCPALSCNIPQVGTYNPAPQLNPTPAPSLSPGQKPPLQIYPGGTQPVIGGTQYPGGGYAIPGGTSYSSIRSKLFP